MKNKACVSVSQPVEVIFRAPTASQLPYSVFPSAVGEILQTSVQYYTAFFFFFSIGKEKIPLGTQVITFFRGECVGPGPV